MFSFSSVRSAQMIPVSDKDYVRLELLRKGAAISRLAKHYGCNRKTVSRFITKHFDTKYDLVSDEELADIIHSEQQGNKQTFGFTRLKSKLAARNSMYCFGTYYC